MSNNSTNSKSCMIHSMVLFTVTLSDRLPRFQGHGVIFINVLCAQLTRDLFAIAKFLFTFIASISETTTPINMKFQDNIWTTKMCPAMQ